MSSTLATTTTAASATTASYKYYISITGLQVAPLKFPVFGWFTVPVVPQAQRSAGNVSTQTTMRNGTNYTLTAWESRPHMLQFMRSGAHAKAMRQERNVGIFAQTHGYSANDIPEWNDAIQMLHAKGRVHFDVRDKTTINSWSRLMTYVVSTTAVLLAVEYASSKVLAVGGSGTIM